MTADIAWTARPELGRVFLIQCRTALERRLLQDWIETSREAAGVADAPARVLRIPSRHRGARRSGAVDALLDALSSGEKFFFVPLRVMWMPVAAHRGFGVNPFRLMLGDPRSPGHIAQRLIYHRDPARARVLVAEGASLDELRSRFLDVHGGSAPDALALANFIQRQAVLALERAERNHRGSRYKVPRLLAEEVLSKPRLLKALAEEAERSGRPLAEVLDEARDCLREMAPELKTWALDIMAGLGRYLYTRGFDPKIDYLDEDLARVRRLSAEYPVAFLMTHKSHLDGFLLIYIFYDLDMPPVHVFGGINMSFLGLGALGKRSGAIWIRRNMTGDNVYKAVFKQYIDYLAEKRFPLLWALEGTRSRTGKLMPPRYGLINYVVDSYVRSASTDMVLMPVAIGYDQVPEVRDYIAEQKGIAKQPESASWFMQYISGLRNPFGRIHVRFGRGVKLS
ncbi:MAG: 1-acyl-sn-glycerol-3-phosphate acyltransferase, partial [Deltaproteobacteria bacterium]|nr:1-acyl-sn-glycerol-3-phosphate acyltransferase [Deltaproteobacteria bacterium]